MEIQPIGILRSPFTEQKGTPIQPAYAKGTKGRIEMAPAHEAALSDLDRFERIWVLCYFDKAAPYRLRITPYRDTQLRGLFATRAPARPNPIGMSVLRLDRIEGNVLYVSDVDILDQTPVIDIKPYVPAFDSHPGSKAGWLDEKEAGLERADGRFEKD